MKHLPHRLILCFFFCFAFLDGRSQSEQQTGEKQYKNIIRYNFSGPLFMGIDKYLVFGYERILKKNQSFSINAGPVALARFREENLRDDFFLKDDTKNNGFNFSADYRFYLGKENRYAAPRGIYIGPYLSYNKFHRESVWTFNDSSMQVRQANTMFDGKVFSFGAELGYQFVLWKRLALDFALIGPGVGFYRMDLDVSSNLSTAQKQNLREQVRGKLDQFPGVNYLLSDKHFDTEGTIKTWALGYRYIVHVGYLF
jgi:hypothetical protein